MAINGKIKQLYDAIKSDGGDVGTEEEFNDWFLRPGEEGYNNRKRVYDTFKSDGADVGANYEEFRDWLGLRPADAGAAASTAAPSAPTQQPSASVEAEVDEDWQPTSDQKAVMSNIVQSSLAGFNRRQDEAMERLGNTADYYNRGGCVLNGRKPIAGDVRYNPYKGEVEQTYITPNGTVTADKREAERETRAYNDYVDNTTIAGQLRRAGRDLTELHRKREMRVKAIHEKWKESQEKNNAPLAVLLGSNTYSPTIESDPEYRALTAAIHSAEERVRTLQHESDRQGGKDVGFWRGFGEVVSDLKTWDFGYSDFMDAMTRLDADDDTNPHRIAKSDDVKRSEQIMMEQIREADDAAAKYGDNESFFYRAGVMSAEMLPFVLDFAVMGGSSSGTSLLTRNIGAVLLKGLHKAAPKVARKKAVQWTTKVVGAMPEDLLYRAPLMTNSVQSMKTSADIIDRKLGNVVEGDDGNYVFSNDKTWGSAVWQGEANAIIENYSEMFGTHLEGVLSLGTMAKVADIFGAKRMSDLLTKASSGELSGIAATVKKHFSQLGVSDYVGEVGEEYYGQLWRTMLNVDDAYKHNPDGSRTNLFLDGQFHGDIWGGMALSMGLMGLGRHSITAASYLEMKYRVNRADKRASGVFDADAWEGLRERIDGTTNNNIGELADKVIFDDSLSDEQKDAVMGYMEASMNLRGFNLASIARQRGMEMSAEEALANEGYIDGYSATTPQEMVDARLEMERQRMKLVSSMSEDVADEFDADPLDALARTYDPEIREIASKYVNARMVYDGMIQRVRDDIDGRIAQSDAMIDGRVNRDTGMIQGATLTDGKEVYVVNGSVAMLDDGINVDIENSDESLIVRDAEGRLEFVAPSQVQSLLAPVDAASEKEAAAEAIRNEIAQSAADKIDGVLHFAPNDVYAVINEDGSSESLTIVGESVDASGVAVDGMVDVMREDGSVVAMNTADIQRMVDESNARRLEERDKARESAEADKGVEADGGGLQGDAAADAERSTALSRIPVDESGEPLYEQVDADTAWDAFVEQSEGDEEIAREVVADIVAEKRKELADAEKALKSIGESKPNASNGEGALTVQERIVAKMALKRALTDARDAVERAKGVVDHWQSIGDTVRRRAEAEAAERRRQAEIAAEEARQAAERERIEAEEAERLKREALNGVPDWGYDTAADARARGYRRAGTDKVDRQRPIASVMGKEIDVKFSDRDIVKGRVAIIDAGELQPSHIQGERNPAHFLDEAQPKERNDAASVVSAQKIASNIRPEEITSSVTAYTGAPTVNSRGEVIQGNSRSDALRLMYESQRESAERYKQYLVDHAADFGLTPEQIVSMDSPVLVNVVDVDDHEAIRLGQFVAQDTESGGVERIKTKNAVQKMGDKIRNFANILLSSTDDEATFAQLMDANGVEVLKWMNQHGFITDTQYASAFDSRGNLTGEAVNDLKGIMYQSIFTGGSTRLEEMFNKMPAKAQRAILATAFRDYDSALDERMIGEIQQSIIAFDALTGYEQFRDATNAEATQLAVEAWKRQYAFDDVSGESYLPSETFSNFALALAAMYKGHTQKHIQGVFNAMYDIIQGTEQDNLFESADKTPKPLADAIRRVLNIDYQPIVKTITDNGTNGDTVLDINSEDGQDGRPGSDADASGAEQDMRVAEPADGGGGTLLSFAERGRQGDIQNTQRRQQDYIPQTEEITANLSEEETDEYGKPLVLAKDGTTVFGFIDFESGLTEAPIRLSLGENSKDKKGVNHGYGLMHIEAGHGDQIRNAGYETVEEFVEDVAKNYTEITEGAKIGDNQTYLLEVPDKHNNTLFVQLSKDGTYWNVNSAGIFKKRYSRRKPKVYSVPALRDGKDTDTTEVNSGQSNGATAPAGNSSQTSKAEVNENFIEKQADSEEKRDGRKELAAVTMWKKKNFTHTDANHEVTPIPDLSEVSDGKGNALSTHNQIIVDESPYKQEDNAESLNHGLDDLDDSALAERIVVSDDDWTEGDGETPTYKRTINIDGKHTVVQVDEPDGNGFYTGSYFDYQGTRFGGIAEVIEHIDKHVKLASDIAAAEAEVNTSPTDKQKEAGNYKKGHVRVGAFDVTIENPKGSVRRGTDATGKKWEQTMSHTYGYIKGTEGVDGDHIDVFLSSDIDGWDGRRVYVVDQYNPDGTFDEHKVMLGFNSEDDAYNAYLSNYESGWEKGRRLDVGEVDIREFEKWVDSSHRKTKAFSEYKSVKSKNDNSLNGRSLSVKDPNTKGQDNQGNPIDHTGKLIVEDVKSVDEITDDDFNNPTRTIGLPTIPKNVSDAIDAKGRKVIIKRNVFVKNRDTHAELSPEDGRDILHRALYNPNLVGSTQPIRRPDYKVAIQTGDKNAVVVLDVYAGKDNVEIVGWRKVDDKGLEKMKKQSEREGGQFLILSPSEGSAAALSALPFDASSDSKDNGFSANSQINMEQSDIVDASSDKQTVGMESSGGNGVEHKRNGSKRGKNDRRGMDEREISSLLNKMKSQAVTIPYVEITEESWKQYFETPIGNVKMGENQKEKLFNKDRTNQYGMLAETLSNPDIILEESDQQENIFHERPSSYLFIKTFKKRDGSKYVHFENVTVSQGGLEVSISSHIIRENQLKNKMKSDRLLYKATALDESVNSSAEQPINKGDSLSSTGKDNALSSEKQANNKKSSDWNGVETEGTFLGEKEYIERMVENAFNNRKDKSQAREEWEDEDEYISTYNRIADSYVDYISGLKERGELQRMYDAASLGDRIKIRNGVATAGFEVHEMIDFEKERQQARRKRKERKAEHTKAIMSKIGISTDTTEVAEPGQNTAGATDSDAKFSVGSEVKGDADAYNTTKGLVESTGIEVVEVSGEEAQAMMEQKNTPFAGLPNRANEKQSSGSVFLSINGNSSSNRADSKEYEAKLQNKTLSAKTKIAKFKNGDYLVNTGSLSDTIKDLGKLLAMDTKGGSRYTIMRTDKGDTVAIRLSDHRANGNNFGRDAAERNLSIVIERKRYDVPDSGIEFTEVVIPQSVFESRPEEVVSAIVNGVEAVLADKPFTLDSSIGTVEEIGQNVGHAHLLHTPSGVVYGWTVGGKVYMNRDAMNPEAPIHEYTHLWDEMVRRENPHLWERGKDLMKQMPLWNEIVADSNYADIRDDEDAVASEVHARLTGRAGARLLSGMIDTAKGKGAMATAEAVSVVDSLKRWLTEMLDALKATLGKWSKRNLDELTIEDFNNLTLRDIAEGVNPQEGELSDARFHAAMSRGREDFDTVRERAIAERGIVTPGLNGKVIRVVDVPRHDFTGTGKQAIEKARLWADSNLIGNHHYHSGQHDGFTYVIDKTTLEKYLSSSSTKGSDNLGVHLAALKMLPEIINENIEAEIHVDYVKGNGKRSASNGIGNPDILIHRMFGAITIDGALYRVKTTIKEDRNERVTPYNYQVTELELLISGSETSDALSNSNSISAANLLQGVEKSYDPGKKLLEESRLSDVSEAEDVRYRSDELTAERERSGDGSYSDAEVSMENDPWSKAWGETLRSKREQRAFAKRERERMRAKAVELSERLGVDIEIIEDNSSLEGKRGRSKGWYSVKDGRISVVIGNHVSVADIEKTVLHEAVAHHGLRELLGEHFDEFLDKVYDWADNSIKERIALLASRNGWNRRVATEEYLAGLAEDTDFENAKAYNGWWGKIKRLFLDMLSAVGFKRTGVELSDNELRYILWRSYKNMVEPGRFRAFEWEAEDVAMKYNLKAGEYAKSSPVTEQRVAEAGELYELNDRFNNELNRQIAGDLPQGHVYDMGMPSEYLLSTGIARLPIRLSAKILNVKSNLERHAYNLETLRNLVYAIQKPWAIFSYGDRSKAQNMIIGIEDNGRQFLVGISINPTIKGRVLEINSIRNVFPKNNHEWVNWINEGKLLRVDGKKEIQDIIAKLRMNPVAFDYVDLDNAAKIVENFKNPTIREQNNNDGESSDDGVRYRMGDFTPRDRKIAADVYDKMVSSARFEFSEAMQDSMLGLKKLYEAIKGKKGFRIEEVEGYENAYTYENRMSSTNGNEQHLYFIRKMKPLLKAISDICGNSDSERRILTDYMIAKHGLERNVILAERDAREAASKGADYNDELAKCRQRDYSGLTALTGEKDLATAERVAQQMVDDYERDTDTTELWSRVKSATEATLEKMYTSGLMSEDRFNQVRGMFQHYIPLRGWDETTSNEVYTYLLQDDHATGTSLTKKAGGRSSKADDPIANIAAMADSAISQGNRNIMKQRFLNFVLNNPSDLVSHNELWLEHDAVNDEWRPVFAELDAADTPADVAKKIEAFEARMESLQAQHPDKYKRGSEAVNIPYKVVGNNLREHQVLVRRNGATTVLTINGNPRAAQALNGLTNPDVKAGSHYDEALSVVMYVNRQLSALYTTRNPDFVVSNFMRDMLYSNCMTWVKETPSYALRYHRNFGKFNPAVMAKLLNKYENGTLNSSDYIEHAFEQFMANGGETGFTNLKDIEGHKRAIAKELRRQGNVALRGWSALGMKLDLMNRSVENCARFAAYVTSREMGRSVDRSVYDAKEISVNFNKKGSGGTMAQKNRTLLGKIGAHTSGWGRLLYVFWNAGIQGMTNYGRAAKRNPAKATAAATALFSLGWVIPLLAQAGGGDDDDKNAYYNLPSYIRRSNICFRAGEQWVTIPLPIEYRAIYGLGELAYGAISGNERYSDDELCLEVMAQFSQLLPIDMLEGGGGLSPFIPSAAKPAVEAYVMNKSWTGLPIYKDTGYNKDDPEWTKAYKNADQHLVKASRWLNEVSGGDDFKKGRIDVNPAKLEYLLNGMFGGMVSFPSKVVKTVETIGGSREFEWRNIPLANRVIRSGDERTANRRLKSDYYKYKKEAMDAKRLARKYESRGQEGFMEYAEKADFLYNSPEYRRALVFTDYEPDIKALEQSIDDAGDPNVRKMLETDLYSTMREMVNELDGIAQE